MSLVVNEAKIRIGKLRIYRWISCNLRGWWVESLILWLNHPRRLWLWSRHRSAIHWSSCNLLGVQIMLRRHFIRECCNTLRIDSRLQKMRDALLLNLELLLISYLTHFFKSVREIYVSRRLRLFFCFCLFFFKFKDNNIKK